MVYTNKELLDIAAKVIEEHGGELEIVEFNDGRDMWTPRVAEQPDGLVDLSISIDCSCELELYAEYWQEYIPHGDMKGLIEELELVRKIFDEIRRRTT